MDGMNNAGMNTAQSGQHNMLDKSDRQFDNGIKWIGSMAPRAVVGTRQNIEVIAEYDYSKYGIRVEVLEYQKLLGNTNVFAAQNLYFMNEDKVVIPTLIFFLL